MSIKMLMFLYLLCGDLIIYIFLCKTILSDQNLTVTQSKMWLLQLEVPKNDLDTKICRHNYAKITHNMVECKLSMC